MEVTAVGIFWDNECGNFIITASGKFWNKCDPGWLSHWNDVRISFYHKCDGNCRVFYSLHSPYDFDNYHFELSGRNLLANEKNCSPKFYPNKTDKTEV
uniref:SKICH domain-containing protein n=2 Tax=Bursaphelenchus xylophilus TaxID=6326 RepID=A0A1I7SIL8_BURXY